MVEVEPRAAGVGDRYGSVIRFVDLGLMVQKTALLEVLSGLVIC